MSRTVDASSRTAKLPAGNVFLARQPICHRDLRTVGYELLFRDSFLNRATIENGDRSTVQTILNSFMEIGLNRIVGDRLAFVNVTRDFILNGSWRALPKNRVVLEVLENDSPDEEIVDALARLSKAGYRIALVDYVSFDKVRPLIGICDFIKINARVANRSTIKEELQVLQKCKASLLAEKVETYEEFEFYKGLGCDYFQGYFFCRPTMLSAKRTPVNRAAILRLLARLQAPDVGPRDIEDIIVQDLSLSYRLLRYINSAYVALPRKVQSLSQAARLIGTERLRAWAHLMLVNGSDGKPQELMVTSMVRARMCELLALKLGHTDREAFFTVGLFSCLEAFLDRPMEEALSELPLSDSIRDALLSGQGDLGELLRLVVAYEQSNWEEIHQMPVDEKTMQTIFLDSIEWTEASLSK